MESLSNHYRAPEPKRLDESLNKNAKKNYEGYLGPKGPKKYMTTKEKDKVHLEIDLRLEKLEKLGLSKEEILYDDQPGGIPLKIDPFFQFLKKNRIAREMIIEAGEEFTAEKVVDIALKQDVGLDPNVARRKREYYLKHEETSELAIKKAKGWLDDIQPYDPTGYYGSYLDKKGFSNKVDHEDPLHKRVRMPLSRGQLRRQTKQSVNRLDVHWRNSHLLTKFLNPSCKIKSRFQNRLSLFNQRKISKTVKHAKNMMLIPYHGYLRPHHRRNLTSLQEDIEDHCRRVINLETGHIYVKPKDQPVEYEVENAYQVEDPTKYNEEKHEGIKDLEFEYLPIMPTTEQSGILEAQAYASHLKLSELRKQGIDIDKLKQLKRVDMGVRAFQTEYDPVKELNPEQVTKFEKSFKDMQTAIQDITANSLLDIYIGERACSPKTLDELKAKCKVQKISKSKAEILSDIQKLKAELGVA